MSFHRICVSCDICQLFKFCGLLLISFLILNSNNYIFHIFVDLLHSTEWFFCARQRCSRDTSETSGTTRWEPRTLDMMDSWLVPAITQFSRLRWLISQALHVFWVLTVWCPKSHKFPKNGIPSLRNQKLLVFIKYRSRIGTRPLLPYSKGKTSQLLSKKIDQKCVAIFNLSCKMYSSQISKICH